MGLALEGQEEAGGLLKRGGCQEVMEPLRWTLKLSPTQICVQCDG